MKSFKEFQESVAQEVGGKGLTGAVVRGVANLATGPLKNAVRIANIFRSNKFKDREEFDRDIEAYGKTIDKNTKKTTLAPEDQIKRMKDAATKHPKIKEIKVKKPKN